MLIHNKSASCSTKANRKKKVGKGILNSIINKLPIELHIPGYRFCGPGTKLAKRLARGDQGINGLDEACKNHDIAYSRENNLSSRHSADKVLADQAIKRLYSPDASIGEKVAAAGVAAAMKAKVKLGMGCDMKKTKNKRKIKRRKRVKQVIKAKTKLGKGCNMKKTKSKRKTTRRKRVKKRVKTGGSLSFKDVTKHARMAIKGAKIGNMNDAIKVALKAAKNAKRKKKIRTSRVIPIPKRGGFLPLIPLFAGLSALGALGGGAAGIAKAVNDARAAKESLAESKHHNRAMEEIAMGNGYYVRPYKQGLGLFLGCRKPPEKFP